MLESWLDLKSKGQDHSKNQKPMPWGTRNMPPKKNKSRGSLSNWCDANADPHPTGGGGGGGGRHNYQLSIARS